MANVHRVLLAEDNKINQVVAAGALKKLGYVVDIVDGGGDAVAACLHARFDAVLMDVMMPDMDGYEATSRIRENEAALGTSPVPVIGLSARAMAGDREIALAAGMDDYLTKPFSAEQLIDVLTRCLPPVTDNAVSA